MNIKGLKQELENKFMAYLPAVDQAAAALYKKDPMLARKFITEYSVNQAELTVARWHELYAHLFTKYMDGNVKEVDPTQRDPKMVQPGYGDAHYRLIINQKGEHFRVKKLKGETDDSH